MSFRGRIVHIMLRYRHLLKGQIKREVIDQNTSIEKLRKDCDKTALRMIDRIQGVTFSAADYSDCYAEWIIPPNAPHDKCVLYFHGGGFVMGSALSHRNIVSGFVKRLGLKALVFDYRLAPEHPAPAAVNDSAAVYRWLLVSGYTPGQIVFAGDSAGGGIALAAMLKLKDDGIPLPAACAVFSPCTDMTISGESHQTRKNFDPCTPPGMTETYLGYYVGTGDPLHPYTSPLFGDLSGLPSIMIQVGNDETLRDDSTRFSKRAKEAGVDVWCKVWKGMFHCFPLFAPMFPEATEALEQTCCFLRKQLYLL